jgi:hypothetical protein
LDRVGTEEGFQGSRGGGDQRRAAVGRPGRRGAGVWFWEKRRVLRSNEGGEIRVGFVIGYGRLNGGNGMATASGVGRHGAQRGAGGACHWHEVPGKAGWSKTGGAEVVLAGARRVGGRVSTPAANAVTARTERKERRERDIRAVS